MKIRLPEQSVLLVTGGKSALASLSIRTDGQNLRMLDWDVNRPDESHEAFVEALATRAPLIVRMLRSNPAARGRLCATSHAKGFLPMALRLDGSEDLDPKEKFEQVHTATSHDILAEVVPMPFDMSDIEGPFDMIGDVHGCADELIDLLVATGHADPTSRRPRAHPDGRRVVLLGDLTDRGPKNLEVLNLVREMESLGALRVLGNHDDKLARWMIGRKVSLTGSVTDTIAELGDMTTEELHEMGEWLGSAQHHLILDGGRLIAAHAGIDEEHQGRATKGSKAMALYGKRSDKCDETGYPILEDWAASYHGKPVVVHGHVIHAEPYEMNGVVAVDTGCVFGGRLTAYRWPERDFASVPARAVHYRVNGGLRDNRTGRQGRVIDLPDIDEPKRNAA